MMAFAPFDLLLEKVAPSLTNSIQGFAVDKQRKYMIYFRDDSFILIYQIVMKVMVRGELMSLLTRKKFFFRNPVRYQVHNNEIKLIFI